MNKYYGIRLAGYLLAVGLAFAAAERAFTVLAAGILCGTGLVIYILSIIESRTMINLKGLLGLSWMCGMGLACLKLSRIQKEWGKKTWFCFLIIYAMVSIGYEMKMRKLNKKEKENSKENLKEDDTSSLQAGRIFEGIVMITAFSLLCFCKEASVLGFVPLFADTAHAYIEFHVTGFHHITMCHVMVPALSVIYWRYGRRSKMRIWILAVCNLAAMCIPILCVSRYHIIFAIVLAWIVYVSVYQKGIGIWKSVMCVAVILVPLYIIISVARNQGMEYLNTIFEMKNADMPIWISQPYMYVTSNYDNFNYMVEEMGSHAYDGVRMLYPFFALTGLKFLIPVQISRPAYFVKKELSTFSLFYDAFYDFGVIGLVVFSIVLGVVAALLVKRMAQQKNLVINLLYAQFAVYFMLSFFTTWFSDPAVWFRIIITVILYWYVRGASKKSREELREEHG